MKAYELFAIIPAASIESNEGQLQHLTVGAYTAIFSSTARKAILLPVTRKQALMNAAKRQAILESFIAQGPVIGCRPNVFLSKSEIAALIMCNGALLDQVRHRLSGMVQYQITVNWMADRVLDRFRDSPELVELFQKGKVTPAAIKQSVTALADRLSSQIEIELSNLSDELLHLPRTEDMLCNIVILLKQDHSSALDEAVERIDSIWSEGFRIRQIGPAPATSFALLDPESVSSGEVDAALAHLGLPESFDTTDIAKERHKTLLSLPEQAAYTKRCACIAEAKFLAGRPDQPVILCRALSEDQSLPPFEQQVA